LLEIVNIDGLNALHMLAAAHLLVDSLNPGFALFLCFGIKEGKCPTCSAPTAAAAAAAAAAATPTAAEYSTTTGHP
jgi:hypothetical protein